MSPSRRPDSSRRARAGRRWAGVAAGMLLAGGVLLGLRYYRSLARYARRTYATLITPHLTGREATPLLAGYSVHGIDVSGLPG